MVCIQEPPHFIINHNYECETIHFFIIYLRVENEKMTTSAHSLSISLKVHRLCIETLKTGRNCFEGNCIAVAMAVGGFCGTSAELSLLSLSCALNFVMVVSELFLTIGTGCFCLIWSYLAVV